MQVVRHEDETMSEIIYDEENNILIIPIDKKYLVKRKRFTLILGVISCFLASLMMMRLKDIDLFTVIFSVLLAGFVFLVVLLNSKKVFQNWCIIFTQEGVILNHSPFFRDIEVAEDEFLCVKKDMKGKNWLLVNSNRPKMKGKIIVNAYPKLLEDAQNRFRYILPS